jgi:hypothetical protein
MRDAHATLALTTAAPLPPEGAGAGRTRVEVELCQRNDDLAARLHEANASLSALRASLARLSAIAAAARDVVKSARSHHMHDTEFVVVVRRELVDSLERSMADNAPEAIPPKDDHDRGLYGKYDVRRLDGSSGPGGKHEHCEYFVLDLSHDSHAIPAIHAYAKSCEGDYPKLAADLIRTYDLAPSPVAGVPVCPDCGATSRLAESDGEPGRYMCLRCRNDFDGPPGSPHAPSPATDRGEQPHCTHEAALQEAMETIADLRRQHAAVAERERERISAILDRAKAVIRRHDYPQSYNSTDLSEAVHELRCAIARHEAALGLLAAYPTPGPDATEAP